MYNLKFRLNWDNTQVKAVKNQFLNTKKKHILKFYQHQIFRTTRVTKMCVVTLERRALILQQQTGDWILWSDTINTLNIYVGGIDLLRVTFWGDLRTISWI